MESTELLRSLHEGVLTITFNRPEVYNALTMAMWRELLTILEEAAMDPAVRVVVITGAGNAFCTGADVRSFGTVDEGDPLAVRYSDDPVWMDTELRIARNIKNAGISELLHGMGKPTIAAVRGPAAGAGFSFAAACDFRIASDTASFSAAFARIGTSGDHGICYYLTHLIGPTKARELLFLSAKTTAEEALKVGLVSSVVPDDQLEAEVSAFAGRLAAGPAVALRLIKQNLLAAETERLNDVIELEARNMVRSLQTEDSKEAVRAFREKRTPEFKGR